MSKSKAGLLQRTLDMLILKALSRGPLHGYGVGQRIAQISDDTLEIGGVGLNDPINLDVLIR